MYRCIVISVYSPSPNYFMNIKNEDLGRINSVMNTLCKIIKEISLCMLRSIKKKI